VAFENTLSGFSSIFPKLPLGRHNRDGHFFCPF